MLQVALGDDRDDRLQERRRALGTRRARRPAALHAALHAALVIAGAILGASALPAAPGAGDRPAAAKPQPRPARDAKRTPPDAAAKEMPLTIELHIGIPGFAYIGQGLKDLLQRFPGAKVTPFANQTDVVVVTLPEQGLSFYVVGPAPDALRVASVGFQLDGDYMGAKEGGYRTREGIGKGSTVNDLLETYGKPTQVTGERGNSPAIRRTQAPEDPNAPKKFHYASPDGKLKTYFVVEGSRVTRVVVNDLAPLEHHLIKRSPEN